MNGIPTGAPGAPGHGGNKVFPPGQQTTAPPPASSPHILPQIIGEAKDTTSLFSCLDSARRCLCTARRCLSTVHRCLSAVHRCFSSVHRCLSTVHCCFSSVHRCFSSVHCCLSTVHRYENSVGHCPYHSRRGFEYSGNGVRQRKRPNWDRDRRFSGIDSCDLPLSGDSSSGDRR